MSYKGPIGKAEQLDYLVQWFLEYSEMQKDDFLHVLLEMYSPGDGNCIANCVNNIDISGDRPPSIFQCRMKLFREWFVNWSDEEKSELLTRLERLDEKFMEKFREDSGPAELE